MTEVQRSVDASIFEGQLLVDAVARPLNATDRVQSQAAARAARVDALGPENRKINIGNLDTLRRRAHQTGEQARTAHRTLNERGEALASSLKTASLSRALWSTLTTSLPSLTSA